ncbi:MAG TPA: hypothetical protein VJK49_01495 [Candidatus Limnocylindrales bacterium]|nr:hypothetical protein [Candidatus Limnocylindrales bacterium]
MSDFSVNRFSAPDAGGPVTCAVCGCRLVGLTGLLDGAYRHFPSMKAGQDARGCRTACVDALHDRDGRSLLTGGLDGPAALDSAAA